MNAAEAKSKIVHDLSVIFPENHVEFSFDHDDACIVYVRVYGVPDDRVNDSKKLVWDVIDSLGIVDGVDFVPSIISMTNTKRYHSELLPAPYDFDRSLPDVILPMLGSFDSLDNPPSFYSCPRAADGWNGIRSSSVLHVIDEVPHERNDVKLAA